MPHYRLTWFALLLMFLGMMGIFSSVSQNRLRRDIESADNKKRSAESERFLKEIERREQEIRRTMTEFIQVPGPSDADKKKKDLDESGKQIEELRKLLAESKEQMLLEQKRLDALMEKLDERRRASDRFMPLPRVEPAVRGTIGEVAGDRLTFTLRETRGLRKGEKIVAFRFEPSSVTYGELVVEEVNGKEIVGKLTVGRTAPMPEAGDVILFDLQCGR